MTHDPSNPFQKLAKTFAARRDTTALPAADTARSSRKSKGATAKKRESTSDMNDDAALFLDTVGSIAPVQSASRKKQKDSGHGLGDVLSSKLQEKQEKTNKNNLAEENAPDAESTAGASMPASVHTGQIREVTGREFLAAMREAPSHNAEERAGAAEEQELFAKAMQGVAPVNGKGREVAAGASRLAATPLHDPAKALRDVLEGRVEFALLHTDEFMEGYVVGIDPLVLARLRNGQYSPEKHLDLHGKNARQAYEALLYFIQHAYQRGLRNVVVVTGRGKNSPDGVGVLRPLLQQWLCRDPFKRVVLAFCTAKPRDGGPGAVYVLLRKYKKSRGKIIWEHTPSDEDFPDI